MFSHHPQMMMRGTALAALRGYEDLVLGTLAGHIHVARNTNPRTRFTQVGAVSQGGTTDNGFYVGSLAVRKPSSRSKEKESGRGLASSASTTGHPTAAIPHGSAIAFGELSFTMADDWVRWNGPAGEFPRQGSWKCCG